MDQVTKKFVGFLLKKFIIMKCAYSSVFVTGVKPIASSSRIGHSPFMKTSASPLCNFPEMQDCISLVISRMDSLIISVELSLKCNSPRAPSYSDEFISLEPTFS